jgi:hypothetical protein
MIEFHFSRVIGVQSFFFVQKTERAGSGLFFTHRLFVWRRHLGRGAERNRSTAMLAALSEAASRMSQTARSGARSADEAQTEAKASTGHEPQPLWYPGLVMAASLGPCDAASAACGDYSVRLLPCASASGAPCSNSAACNASCTHDAQPSIDTSAASLPLRDAHETSPSMLAEASLLDAWLDDLDSDVEELVGRPHAPPAALTKPCT